MRRRIRIGTIVVLAVSGLGAYSAFAALQSADPQSSSSSISATQSNKESDSIQVRYPVTKTSPESYDEIGQLAPMDLKYPARVSSFAYSKRPSPTDTLTLESSSNSF